MPTNTAVAVSAERRPGADGPGSPAATAMLTAVTEEARQALGGRTHVVIKQFPFKVGRESRLSPRPVARWAAAVDRRLRKSPELNDLYLIEPPSPLGFHISREHFAIDWVGSDLVLIDRNSTCGTCVGEYEVGFDSKDVRAQICDGDLITVGSRHSPYVYQFRWSSPGEQVDR